LNVSDDLANGAVGKLVHIETDETGIVTRVWLEFPDSPRTGQKIRTKAAAFVQGSKPIISATQQFPLHEELRPYI
jgi:hypothetical protein